MGSPSKKVPYLRDNFLFSACQFTASSQGNGKFTEFVRLHGADSISQKSPKFYLLTHYFFAYPFFSPFAKVFHHQSFPLYGIALVGKHTYTHTNARTKTISRNQVCTWFKNQIYYLKPSYFSGTLILTILVLGLLIAKFNMC